MWSLVKARKAGRLWFPATTVSCGVGQRCSITPQVCTLPAPAETHALALIDTDVLYPLDPGRSGRFQWDTSRAAPPGRHPILRGYQAGAPASTLSVRSHAKFSPPADCSRERVWASRRLPSHYALLTKPP